jgi:hypothetical protein
MDDSIIETIKNYIKDTIEDDADLKTYSSNFFFELTGDEKLTKLPAWYITHDRAEEKPLSIGITAPWASSINMKIMFLSTKREDSTESLAKLSELFIAKFCNDRRFGIDEVLVARIGNPEYQEGDEGFEGSDILFMVTIPFTIQYIVNMV